MNLHLLPKVMSAEKQMIRENGDGSPFNRASQRL